MFAVILIAENPSNPLLLWNNHKESMSEDFLYQARQAHPDGDVDFSDEIFNHALIAIEDKLLDMENKLLTDFGLPAADRQAINIFFREVQREANYDMNILANQVEQQEPWLTADQSAAYAQIIAQVEMGGGFIFLDAPGGTGKTFFNQPPFC